MREQKTSEVQASYDRAADEYARHIYDELQHKPLDCQLLDRFADRVRDAGRVCDLGCGPGQVARYLHEHGVAVCGVDLSAEMVERARRLNPGIEFRQGDILALDVEDQAWAGIAAFYAIVNFPAGDLVPAMREMYRLLCAGGWLLLSFHIGEEIEHVTTCGDALYLSTSIFFVPGRLVMVCGRRDLRSRKLSSAILMRPRSSIRAGGLTYLRESLYSRSVFNWSVQIFIAEDSENFRRGRGKTISDTVY